MGVWSCQFLISNMRIQTVTVAALIAFCDSAKIQGEYTYTLWQYGLRSFQPAGTKNVLHKNQHTQRKWLNFEFWINGELSKIEHHFSNKEIHIFKNWCYQKMLTLKVVLPINADFDNSPLIQNSKFNHFFWVCWFFCKNRSNLVTPAWKLHNP